MQLILTHENADFDAVASLQAAHKLFPKALPLLPRRLNRNVGQFLTLYWDAFSFTRPSDWKRRRVDELILVDTQAINNVRGLVKQPSVQVIDHHMGHEPHEHWQYQVEPVGAATTLLVEKLQQAGVTPATEEVTLFLLGIYEDTGSLSYDTTTPRDIRAAAWLLDQGALLPVVRRFLNIPLSEAQLALYNELNEAAAWHEIRGQSIVVTKATAPDDFEEEISSITHRLREALSPSGLFVLVQMRGDVQLVARSTTDKVDVSVVAKAVGGGGHSRAAAAHVGREELMAVYAQVMAVLPQAVQPMLRVADLMSYGVQTLEPTTTVQQAAEQMRRYGYEGYPVLDPDSRQIVGLLTRRAVDRALGHNMDRQPISRVMRSGSVTVRPSDTIDDLQQLMLAEGWGQIPVVANEDSRQTGPIGIVTRTDLLNTLFTSSDKDEEPDMRQMLVKNLPSALWEMVNGISEVAATMKLPLYFVGGLVRDLLLDIAPTDLDMVVEGDAIQLARELAALYGGDVHAHKRFGTAKWTLVPAVWQALFQRHGEELNPQQPPRPQPTPVALSSIDFVTARTEFYKEPTALPQVTTGSIKLDLHRRDFTINTLAVRLDGAFLGQLLDFYGGRRDLKNGVIRVLHSLSFVDDPTRILRAIRLEQRLLFTIEDRTLELIQGALPLFDRVSGDRIRHEFELAFQETNPIPVLDRLEALTVLPHLHPALCWPDEAAEAFGRLNSVLQAPGWQTLPAAQRPTFIYFALWMMSLTEAVQQAVMERLRVRKATHTDVLACCQMVAAMKALPAKPRPSQVEKALRPFPPRVLLVGRVWLQAERLIRLLDQYFRSWRRVKTAVTGDTLRELGLKPGPRYAVLLDQLLAARLDGEVENDEEEKAYLNNLLAAENE